MTPMMSRRVLPIGVTVVALSAGAASAATTVEQATGSVVTLLGIALLLWVIGNFLTYHRYDHGGPKGAGSLKPR